MLCDLIDANEVVLRESFKLRPDTPSLKKGQRWVKSTSKLITVEAPTIVTRYQGMCALYQSGLLDDVQTYMQTADPVEQLAWKEFSEFNRGSYLVKKIGALLELTETKIDDLFRFASSITT